MKSVKTRTQVVRSRDGIIAGVCQGIADRMGIESWIVRLVWMFSVLAYGTGILFYFILAFCLPKEGQESKAMRSRFLGVCSFLSQKIGVDVGLVRAAVVFSAFASLGLTFIAYIVAYFFIPDETNDVVPF